MNMIVQVAFAIRSLGRAYDSSSVLPIGPGKGRELARSLFDKAGASARARMRGIDGVFARSRGRPVRDSSLRRHRKRAGGTRPRTPRQHGTHRSHHLTLSARVPGEPSIPFHARTIARSVLLVGTRGLLRDDAARRPSLRLRRGEAAEQIRDATQMGRALAARPQHRVLTLAPGIRPGPVGQRTTPHRGVGERALRVCAQPDRRQLARGPR